MTLKTLPLDPNINSLTANGVGNAAPPAPSISNKTKTINQIASTQLLNAPQQPSKSSLSARCWSCLKYIAQPFIAIWECFKTCLCCCCDPDLPSENIDLIKPIPIKSITFNDLMERHQKIGLEHQSLYAEIFKYSDIINDLKPTEKPAETVKVLFRLAHSPEKFKNLGANASQLLKDVQACRNKLNGEQRAICDVWMKEGGGDEFVTPLLTQFEASQAEESEKVRKIIDDTGAGILANLQAAANEINAGGRVKKIEDFQRLVECGCSEYLALVRARDDAEIPDVAAQIQQIFSSTQSGLVDLVGLPNFNRIHGTLSKNTCWLNSALQVMRLNPAVVRQARAPLNREVVEKQLMDCEFAELAKRKSPEKLQLLVEEDYQWREAFRQAIAGVWDAMEQGSQEVIQALFALDEMLHPDLPPGDEPKNWIDVPAWRAYKRISGDIADPQQRMAYHDAKAFINLVFDKLGITFSDELWVRESSKGSAFVKKKAELRSSLEIPILNEEDKKGKKLDKKNFIKLFEAPARSSGVSYREERTNIEKLFDQERRIAVPPQALVTQLQRVDSVEEGGISSSLVGKVTASTVGYVSKRAVMKLDETRAELLQEKTRQLVRDFLSPEQEGMPDEEVQDVEKYITEEAAKLELHIRSNVSEQLKNTTRQYVQNLLGKPAAWVEKRIGVPVEFPKNGILDCTNTTFFKNIGRPIKYRLTGFCVQESFGNSPKDGHYIGYALGRDGQWRCYNDGVVNTLGEKIPYGLLTGSYLQFWELI